MKTVLIVALLLAQQPQNPPPPQPVSTSCVAQTVADLGPKPIRAYVCQRETAGEQGPVPKAWFKAHCHVWSDDSVTCDAYAPDAAVAPKDAAKPGNHIVRNIALTAVVTLIVAACISGGGCGAMGGGD